MTEQRCHGSDIDGAPKHTIKSVGTGPMLVQELAGSIAIRRADALRATPLEPGGQALPPADMPGNVLNLRPTTRYYLIEPPATSRP
jgi:hypothetical protein